MVKAGDPCPECGTALKEIDVDSPHMNAYCPECAPDCVLSSPAVTGGDSNDGDN